MEASTVHTCVMLLINLCDGIWVGSFVQEMMRVAGADIFRESNKAADTHANWLMDNGDSNPGAQWKRRDHCVKLKSAKHVVLSFDGARRGNGNGAAAWILWIRNMNGEFDRISHGGKLLKDTTAMTAECEVLRMGVEHTMTLFPAEAKKFSVCCKK